MMIVKRKPNEKQSLPQLRDLREGEFFYLPSNPDKIYLLTSYNGEDWVGLQKWVEGSVEIVNLKFDKLYNAVKENLERDKCPDLYRVVVPLGSPVPVGEPSWEEALIHKAVEVVPVHCELYYQEMQNYNI